MQKAISVFEWELPATWNKDYFLYVLYCFGREAIVNTDRFGVIPQACGLMGYNVFYQPTNALITNPLLTGMLQPRIDVDCTLFKLQPDYGGILDLVRFYGNMLAHAAQSAAVNLNNSKLMLAFFARNKAGAEAFKRAFDAMANGQPMTVFDKNLLTADGQPAWTTLQQDIKQQAEAILTRIGLPRSVAIDMFYRQIILWKGLPFRPSVPASRPASLDEMTKEEFDAKMVRGLEQAKNGEGVPADDFFSSLREEILKSYV